MSDPIDEILHSWDCESLSDLERLIFEIKGRIEDFTRRGSFKMVEEEKCELELLLQAQSDIETILMQGANMRDNQGANIVSTSDWSGTGDVIDDWEPICLSSSFDEDASNSVMSGRSQLQIAKASAKDLNGPCIPAVSLPPLPITSITQDYCETKTISSLDNRQCVNSSLASSRGVVPDCAEKSLSLLHVYFKEESKRLWSIDTLLEHNPHPLKSRDFLIDLFAKLDRQLQTEMLEFLAKKDLPELKKLFSQYMSKTADTRINMRELVDGLEQVLLRIILAISPLDVSLLLGSIRGSCMTANLIKDKDVIILLGSTGVGKSTLMHFLAGSKMRVTDVEGIPHLEPEEVMSGLEDVKFSCSSRSVTTGIHAITMNMNGETYIVCDTAGFDDTRAVEYDIASGIVMTNAIRSTRSVKLVLVIDQGTIAMRLSNLRKNLIPAIIKLIPSFKNYVGSVFYLFNMISDPIKTVAARLREISMNLNPAEKADADFAAMISDLAKKSATEKHAAVTDLINPDRAVYLKLLQDLNAVEPILHPEKVFCHFAATTSISILNQQLNLHKAAIWRGLDGFEASGSNTDLLLVDYKLRQLLDLHLLVGLPECEGCYVSSLEATYRFVNKLHCKTFQRVQSWFEDDCASDSDIDAELSTCIQQVLLLFELESIRDFHDGDKVLGKLNVREIILHLFLRKQIDCKRIVDTHFKNILSTSDADINSMMSTVANSMNGCMASSKLTKMRILSSVLQQGNYSNFGMDHSCSLTYNHCFTSILFRRTGEESDLCDL